MLKKLKEMVDYNYKQLEKVDFDQNQAENLYTIESNGQEVYDFFHDETMRDKVDPIEYYGKEKLEHISKHFKGE